MALHGNALMTARLLAAGLDREDVLTATGISRSTFYRYTRNNEVKAYINDCKGDIPIREEALEALRRAVRKGSVPAIRLALTQVEQNGQTSNENNKPGVTIIDDLPDLPTALANLVQQYGKTGAKQLVDAEFAKIPDNPTPTTPLALTLIDES